MRSYYRPKGRKDFLHKTLREYEKGYKKGNKMRYSRTTNSPMDQHKASYVSPKLSHKARKSIDRKEHGRWFKRTVQRERRAKLDEKKAFHPRKHDDNSNRVPQTVRREQARIRQFGHNQRRRVRVGDTINLARRNYDYHARMMDDWVHGSRPHVSSTNFRLQPGNEHSRGTHTIKRRKRPDDW